jgi:AcrR family transcriptional regulator
MSGARTIGKGTIGEAFVVTVSNWRTYPPLELPPILRVALAEIVEHGYDATSVRTIAKRLGVTVPALYYHFENKQAMLVALLDHAMDIVVSHARSALADAGEDCTRRLSALVESIALYMAHHSDLAFLDSERRSLTPDNRKKYFAERSEIESALRMAIQAGTDEGAFGTKNPDECARAILSMCQGIAGWYRPDGKIPPETMAMRYVDIALAAVVHRPDGAHSLGSSPPSSPGR